MDVFRTRLRTQIYLIYYVNRSPIVNGRQGHTAVYLPTQHHGDAAVSPM